MTTAPVGTINGAASAAVTSNLPAVLEPVGGKHYHERSVDTSENALLFDRSKFEQAWSVAQMFSSSDLVPQHFRGKPANCFIACQLAYRFKMDPFMVMQNTYVVHGRPGFEGKFIIALVNASGLFTDPLEFAFSGTPESDDWAVTVRAVRARTGRVCEMVFRWRTAVAEKWVSGNAKWKSMPEQMMMYRGAAFFSRVYCPEVIMGMASQEELEDIAVEVQAPLQVGRSSFRTLPAAATVVADVPATPADQTPATDDQPAPGRDADADPPADPPAPDDAADDPAPGGGEDGVGVPEADASAPAPPRSGVNAATVGEMFPSAAGSPAPRQTRKR